jgi:hypothetical protein
LPELIAFVSGHANSWQNYLDDGTVTRVVVAATLVSSDKLSLQRILGVLSSKQATVEHLLFESFDGYRTAHLQVVMPSAQATHIFAELGQLVCVTQVTKIAAMPLCFVALGAGTEAQR